MAAGTLPEAPLMRPSVTSATLKPLPCSTASGGVSLCSSGMPLACGPCQRTTHTTSPVQLARLEGRQQRLLAIKHAGRRLDHMAVHGHGRHLDHAAAQVARQQLEATGGLKGALAGRTPVESLAGASIAPGERVAVHGKGFAV
jgi:hypothetical protein